MADRDSNRLSLDREPQLLTTTRGVSSTHDRDRRQFVPMALPSRVISISKSETALEVGRSLRERAAPARQGATRSTRLAPPLGARGRDARAAGGAPGSTARAATCAAQRRRRPPARACTATQRDRHRTRTAPRGAATAADRAADPSLQPLPSLRLPHRRRARDRARAALTRTPHPGRDRGGRRSRARDPRTRPRDRPEAARRGRRGPIAAIETIKRPDNSASQPTSRADHRRLRADPRRGWARR